ncbi:MAG: phage tail tape measure protein, partial [Bacteroidales bacterium]|nr:phage tail tape measure protein [Bacteroidales bacterium]
MANKDMLVRVMADTKNYNANLAQASRTLDQFAKNNLTASGAIKQATSALTGMASQFISVYAAIGAAKKVISDMVNINKAFEQSSANLAAVMGKSRNEISDLTDQAKQLGATTQYTANQILELQANLARLGFNQTEILNSTKSVQAMATAMGADLGEAANLAGAALRGFGLDATEMDRVASVLSVGTTKSALSFEKLATALPTVQTAAAKTGFTIEDTVAMLGKLTDNGINAASAATQLRKILNDSTTAGTKLANALGGPVKSFDELVVALDKAGKAGQNHADSVALVNSKNATALDILRDMAAQRTVEIDGVEKQTSALQELRDELTNCSEGMQAMQDEQLNTLQGSITILNSAWEGLMLTFSESNGVIKSVVDSLTEVLGAWTKWRQRNQGGDAAIKTYEMEDEKVADYGRQYLEADRSAGMSDEAIKRNAETEKAALEQERDDLREVLDLWEKRYNLIKSGQSGLAQGDEFAILREKGLSNTTDVREKLTKQVAQKNSDIAIQDYIISAVTPAPKTVDPDEEEKKKQKQKEQITLLKAQYEEQEKTQIAALDRMSMNEEDYEAEVYRIKRETLQKIADLYQEETAEKARANAAISQLDIQYQGIQRRLANRGSKSTKTYETQTGPSGYSQEGISALRSEIQGSQKSMQMGSSEYMVEASRLVDLTTFENLLKTAVQNGIELDPALLETNFEKIDLGVDVSDEEWQVLVDTINTKLADLGLDPIKLDV